MKTILLTNDDGFDSLGLQALKEALSPLGRVVVVAPAHEKSACGHGLSITKTLRFVELEKDFYKLDDGTPTDCVYLGIHAILKKNKPDLVVSGINIGSNMGEDVTYSGTVAGAMEGSIIGIPSIAFSQVIKDGKDCKNGAGLDFSLAKKASFEIAKKMLESNPLGDRKVLNVNFPLGKESKGYKITQLGYRLYGNDAKRSVNPRGEEYYWLGLHPLAWQERESNIMSDFKAVKEGYISITPLTLNLTSYEDLAKLKF